MTRSNAVERPATGREADAPVLVEPAYRTLRSAAGLTLAEGFDQIAEAIRDGTRRRILVDFYRDATPRTAAEVAANQGISRAVARSHLEVLRAVGYLRLTVRRGRRGKPAHLYALDTDPPHWLPHPPRQMALLALLVLQAAALGPDGAIPLIEQVGWDYGSAVQELRADRPPADLGGALAPLERLGGRLTLTPIGRGGRRWRLDLGLALFHEAAAGRPDLVCHLQMGLVRSLVVELGLVVELAPDGPGASGGTGSGGAPGTAEEETCHFIIRRSG